MFQNWTPIFKKLIVKKSIYDTRAVWKVTVILKEPAVMPPAAQQRRTAASPRTFQTAPLVALPS
jgi:hypothetical protein